ncbi:hypothetical protein NDU88_004136 [Pleurodeles waltl]|uniref:Uncharacterized protein n=1 Tax=Pleurodeles waltl TaxID=8319 RepID=A0AAV7M958_PLEWA|nr:hypothetical protein NDU88_004136 [Pleurodeles waltl]
MSCGLREPRADFSSVWHWRRRDPCVRVSAQKFQQSWPLDWNMLAASSPYLEHNRLGRRRKDGSTKPRLIIACLLRHEQVRQILTIARAPGPFKTNGHEIRITADFLRETNEHWTGFLALCPKIRQPEVKYGLFDPARLWTTKNGVSKNFYNPEDLRLYLDNLHSLSMDKTDPPSERIL